MSLELDFLAALVRQPNQEATMLTMARTLGWDQVGHDFGWPNDQTYGSRLAEHVTLTLQKRGIVEYSQSRPRAHWRVRMVRPPTAD